MISLCRANQKKREARSCTLPKFDAHRENVKTAKSFRSAPEYLGHSSQSRMAYTTSAPPLPGQKPQGTLLSPTMRRERLCQRGRNVREIAGFETVSCKLFEKSHPKDEYFNYSLLHPVSTHQEYNQVIKIPTASNDVLKQILLTKYPDEQQRMEYDAVKIYNSLSSKRTPPRDKTNSKMFVLTWLNAGCEATRFSEDLKNEQLKSLRKSGNIQHPGWWIQ